MIREGERGGALRPGKTMLDATSGNTGIAYAMIGAALGYPVELCLPSNASPERKRILSAYGAKIDLDAGRRRLRRRHSPGARGLCRRRRNVIFIPISTAIRRIGRRITTTTAPEIWEQTQGRVTHFVAGMGTSGTFVGTARRLKELNPAIQCISLQPDAAFHGLEGWKHMATALVPKIYDPTVADADFVGSHGRRVPHGEAAGARGSHAGEPERGGGSGRMPATGAIAAEAARRLR